MREGEVERLRSKGLEGCVGVFGDESEGTEGTDGGLGASSERDGGIVSPGSGEAKDGGVLAPVSIDGIGGVSGVERPGGGVTGTIGSGTEGTGAGMSGTLGADGTFGTDGTTGAGPDTGGGIAIAYSIKCKSIHIMLLAFRYLTN